MDNILMGEKKEKMKEYMKYKYLIYQKDKNCKVKEGKSKKGSEKTDRQRIMKMKCMVSYVYVYVTEKR